MNQVTRRMRIRPANLSALAGAKIRKDRFDRGTAGTPVNKKNEYLERAKEAEDNAAKAQDLRVKADWRKIADDYRKQASHQARTGNKS